MFVDFIGSSTFFPSTQRRGGNLLSKTFYIIFNLRRHYYRINPKWVWISRVHSWNGWVQLQQWIRFQYLQTIESERKNKNKANDQPEVGKILQEHQSSTGKQPIKA